MRPADSPTKSRRGISGSPRMPAAHVGKTHISSIGCGTALTVSTRGVRGPHPSTCRSLRLPHHPNAAPDVRISLSYHHLAPTPSLVIVPMLAAGPNSCRPTQPVCIPTKRRCGAMERWCSTATAAAGRYLCPLLQLPTTPTRLHVATPVPQPAAPPLPARQLLDQRPLESLRRPLRLVLVPEGMLCLTTRHTDGMVGGSQRKDMPTTHATRS